MSTRFSWLLAFAALLGMARPLPAELAYSGKGKEWTFLRGNLDFTLVHPLKVFHGHLGTMSGIARLNPANLGEGVSIVLSGNTGHLVFDEREGARIIQWMGAPIEWRVGNYACILKRTEGEVYFFEIIFEFNRGGKVQVQNVPARCQADEDSFRCKVHTDASFNALGWDRPMLMFLPVKDRFEVSGEFTFGDKGGSG